MKRTRLAPVSAKGRARRATWQGHLADWLGSHKGEAARCQLCAQPFTEEEPAEPHHVRLRSEGGGDGPENLAALHRGCHTWLHDGGIGKPTRLARERLAYFADNACNLTNRHALVTVNVWRRI